MRSGCGCSDPVSLSYKLFDFSVTTSLQEYHEPLPVVLGSCHPGLPWVRLGRGSAPLPSGRYGGAPPVRSSLRRPSSETQTQPSPQGRCQEAARPARSGSHKHFATWLRLRARDWKARMAVTHGSPFGSVSPRCRLLGWWRVQAIDARTHTGTWAVARGEQQSSNGSAGALDGVR